MPVHIDNRGAIIIDFAERLHVVYVHMSMNEIIRLGKSNKPSISRESLMGGISTIVNTARRRMCKNDVY
jgi:hypothetical protein